RKGPMRTAAMRVIEPLERDPKLRNCYLWLAVRGHLLLELGRRIEARAWFEKALDCPCTEPERRFLRRKLRQCEPRQRRIGMKQLDFLYFDAGGGHRRAASALLQVITEQQRPWEVRMVNLQEVLDPLDVFRKLTGRRLQDLYNLMLKKGWTLGSPQLTA